MKFLKFWFPLFFYSGIIFGVSSIPNLQVQAAGLAVDKVGHFLEYALFGWLLMRALRGTGPNLSRPMLCFMVVVFSLLYGMSDELHQIFVAGRMAEGADLLADTLGGAAGGLFYRR